MNGKVFVILSVFVFALFSLNSVNAQEYTVDNNTVALWHLNEGNGTFTFDETGINHGLLSGGGKFGSALSFDNLDFVEVSDSDNLDLTTQGTIEAWIKTPGARDGIIVFKTEGPPPFIPPRWSYILTLDISGTKLRAAFSDGTNVQELIGISLINDNEWHHVAVTWNGTINLFIDGNLDVSTIQSVFPQIGNGTVQMGNVNEQINPPFPVIMDEVMISNIARNPSEFCLNSECLVDNNTVALWHMNEESSNTIFDSTDNNNDGTVNGAVFVSPPKWTTNVAPIDGSTFALDFDGIDDYVFVNNSPSLDITGNEITLDAWIYPLSSPTGNGNRIISKYGPNGLQYLLTTRTPGTIGLFINGGSLSNAGIGNILVPLNKWTHVAGTYDGSTIKIYINGQLDTLTNRSLGNIQSTTTPILIGDDDFHDVQPFNGSIDEVRISNKVRDPSEFNVFVDVAVTSINIIPENPQLGDAVNVSATIKNLGNVETDVKYQLGIQFPGGGSVFLCLMINGSCTTLSPGEELIIFDSANFDIESNGTYSVTASVMAINATDINISNNNLTIEFTVSPPASSLEERVTILEEQMANLTEQVQSNTERIGILESLVMTIQQTLNDFIDKIISFFSHQSKTIRENAVCGYMEDNNLTNHTELGLSCQLIQQGSNTRCRCS